MAKRKPTAKKLTTQARVAVSQTNISTRNVVLSERQQTTLQVDLKARPDFKGAIAAYVFDSAGNLTDQAPVRSGKVTLKTSAKTLSHSRLFIAPEPEDQQEEIRPTIQHMERIGAFEPTLTAGGQLNELIRIPGRIIDLWPLCFCWVKGKVVKQDSGMPVCNARVHICEVDKLIWWILKLPERDIFRLRDDLLKEILKPRIPFPPRPQPDPPPFVTELDDVAFNPQPDPPSPFLRTNLTNQLNEAAFTPQLESARALSFQQAQPLKLETGLNSNSAHLIRETLTANIQLLIPYLCLWPWWWRFRCDEIAVVETDNLGRFSTIISYACNGDKPDLYFWVEYEIDGVWETVYKPPIPCNTYWDYKCGTEVIIRVNDDRVPGCDEEPDLPGCVVQVLSIGRKISMSEILGPGATVDEEGLNVDSIQRPFGGKLEPRVWFSRTTLRDGKNIHYYKWSYRRLTEGDGTPLAVPGPWTPIKRTVVRHYAKPASGGGVSHVPYPLGPVPVGAQTDLFEIKPAALPPGGIEWTVVDEREDLASAHFETHKLGTGANDCEKAFNSAGKYELKLELFKNTGALVDWTAEGIDMEITDVPAPFGTGTVTTQTASNYYRIIGAGGHTMGFRMVLRVDNNCCEAAVMPVSGTGLTVTPCGFIEFGPGATTQLHFKASHPNNFADFDFNLTRAVTTPVHNASVAGRVGSSPVPTDDATHNYTLTPPGDYRESFTVLELLGPCSRAAFAENLHVWARATDGYNRMSHLDRHGVDGFALTQPCPEC